MLIFFNLVIILTGIVFQFWKRSFDYSAVTKDVFSVDESCIFLSKFNQMLSSVLVVKCWENTSVFSVTESILVSIFDLLQKAIQSFSWDNSQEIIPAEGGVKVSM